MPQPERRRSSKSLNTERRTPNTDSRGRPIGLIGLGLLGSGLAKRLLGAGFEVSGYDLDAGRRDHHRRIGGRVARDAAEIVSSTRRVVLSLPTTDVVEKVLEEVRSELQPGQVIVDTTTGEPRRTAGLGSDLAGRGVDYLDATVSGSSEHARRGEVVVMVGGAKVVFDACQDIFASFARRSFHVGPWGSGATMKLVSNLVLGLNRAALAEGLAFAAAVGLEKNAALEILQASLAYSRIMDSKGAKMVEEDFTPQARLSQHLKDVRLMLEAAADTGITLPLTAAHRGLLEAAEAAGCGDLDNSAIIRAYGRPGSEKTQGDGPGPV